MVMSGYSIVVILLMSIGGYFIVAISGYFINGYQWLFYVVIGGYFINGY